MQTFLRYIDVSVVVGLGIATTMIVYVCAALGGIDNAPVGALVACVYGATILVSLGAMYFRGDGMYLPRSTMLWTPIPLLVGAVLSFLGGPLTREIFFGTGFEFGTVAFFALGVIGIFLGAVVAPRIARALVWGIVFLGVSGGCLLAWHVLTGSSFTIATMQYLAMILAAGVVFFAINTDSVAEMRLRLLYGVITIVALALFISVRLPEAAIAGAIALAAVGGSRWVVGSRKSIPVASIAAGLIFVLAAGVSPHTTADQWANERADFSASAAVVAQEYAVSLRYALIGTGPVSLQYAWNMYRAEDFNQTSWWNVTPKMLYSASMSVAMQFGLLGFVALCLFPVALGVMLLDPRRFTMPNVSLFETCAAVALYCVAIAFVYPAGVSTFLIGCVSIGICIRVLSADDVIQYGAGGFSRVTLFILSVVVGIILLYVGAHQLRAAKYHAAGVDAFRANLPSSVAPLQRAAEVWPISVYQIEAAQATLSAALLEAQEQKASGSIDLDAFGYMATEGTALAESAMESNPRSMDVALSRVALYALIHSAGFTSTPGFEDLPTAVKSLLIGTAALAPTRADVRLNQAQFAQHLGELSQAREYAQEALRLKPDYEEARAFLAALPTS